VMGFWHWRFSRRIDREDRNAGQKEILGLREVDRVQSCGDVCGCKLEEAVLF
jgi:hypothetical protein